MNIATIARPYAKAVFAFAAQNDNIENWNSMLDYMSQVVSNKTVSSLVRNPGIRHEQKYNILCSVLEDKIDEHGRNFIKLLAKNQRILFLPAIFNLFVKLQEKLTNKLSLKIVSAKTLSNMDDMQIIKALETKFTGKKISLQNKIEADMLAGVKIKLGDRVIDSSMKNKLNMFYQHIKYLGGIHNGSK